MARKTITLIVGCLILMACSHPSTLRDKRDALRDTLAIHCGAHRDWTLVQCGHYRQQLFNDDSMLAQGAK